MTKLDLPKNYSNPNKRNLRSNSKKINFENELEGSNIIGKLYKKCITPLIRIGKSNSFKYKDLEQMEQARGQEDSQHYQNRRRINSMSESSERLLARHSIANNGNYYFEPKSFIKLHFGLSRGGPCIYLNKKALNIRETKSDL